MSAFVVGVAQSVEHWIVAPVVEGSIPFTHPIDYSGPPFYRISECDEVGHRCVGKRMGLSLFTVPAPVYVRCPSDSIDPRLDARVAELADALDLGSSGQPWGFDSPLSHHPRFPSVRQIGRASWRGRLSIDL